LIAQEEQHLQLLAIFHYIVGGVAAFFACFPLIHLTIGLVMVCGGFSGNQAPPAFVGWLFIILGGAFFLWGKVWRFALSLPADFLARRKRYPFRFCDRMLRMFVYAVRNGAGCVYDRFAVA
jgi:hypothetical protein